MELQIRIAYGTAEMLEFLKEYYEKNNGISFTKGDVLSKAVVDTYDDWKYIDWTKTLSLPISINKDYKLSAGSQRPKFRISNNIKLKLDELQNIISSSLDVKYVQIGALIKFLLRQVIYEIQKSDDVSVENVINYVLDEYLKSEISSDTKESLKKFTNDLLVKLEINDLL